MKKFVIRIRDEIKLKEEFKEKTIQEAWDDFERKLTEDGKRKHKAFKDALTALFEGTAFERKNPPTYGYDKDTDPDQGDQIMSF